MRNVGYWEGERSVEMPARGLCNAVPLRPVSRPDFTHRGLDYATFGEIAVPSDARCAFGNDPTVVDDRQAIA